jgi:hypothetical protein
MASRQDFWEFFDDFAGGAITMLTTAAAHSPWKITDTSAAGTPTYVQGVDDGTTGGGAYGVAAVTLESTNEVPNQDERRDDDQRQLAGVRHDRRP